MANFTIRPLNTGTIMVDKGMYLTRGIDVGRYVPIPAVAWHLTDGVRNVLVDTGMCATARAHWHHEGSFQEPGQAIHEQLATIGIAANDIDTILFTHLHWDHCQNLGMFPTARLLVSDAELQFARNPHPLYDKSYEHARQGVTSPFSARQFDTIDGDTEVLPGISMFPTPGHSPGHYSVAVSTASGTHVIAGDAVFAYVNLEPASPTLRFTIMGRVMDILTAWSSIEAVVERGGIVLPGHDLAVFNRDTYA